MVTLEEGVPGPTGFPAELVTSLPFVIVGTTRGAVDHSWFELCDVVVEDGDPVLAAIEQNLSKFPIASVALALLLRSQPGRSVDEGLVAESAVYSVLQSGPEFAAWRAGHRVRTDVDDGPEGATAARRGRRSPSPWLVPTASTRWTRACVTS